MTRPTLTMQACPFLPTQAYVRGDLMGAANKQECDWCWPKMHLQNAFSANASHISLHFVSKEGCQWQLVRQVFEGLLSSQCRQLSLWVWLHTKHCYISFASHCQPCTRPLHRAKRLHRVACSSLSNVCGCSCFKCCTTLQPQSHLH